MFSINYTYVYLTHWSIRNAISGQHFLQTQFAIWGAIRIHNLWIGLGNMMFRTKPLILANFISCYRHKLRMYKFGFIIICPCTVFLKSLHWFLHKVSLSKECSRLKKSHA